MIITILFAAIFDTNRFSQSFFFVLYLFPFVLHVFFSSDSSSVALLQSSSIFRQLNDWFESEIENENVSFIAFIILHIIRNVFSFVISWTVLLLKCLPKTELWKWNESRRQRWDNNNHNVEKKNENLLLFVIFQFSIMFNTLPNSCHRVSKWW